MTKTVQEQSVCETVEQRANDAADWLTETYNECLDYVVEVYESLPSYRIVKK